MAVRPTLFFCLAACLLCMTSADDSTDKPVVEVATEEQGFHIHLRVSHRQTNYVTLQWDQPNAEVVGYKIECSKDGSEDTIYSPVLSSAYTEYLMDNLMMDSSYHICVRAATNDVKQPDDEASLVYNEEECIDTTTIPKIRDDSILALCIALGYILGCIIVGYICWWCAKRRIEASMEEEEEEPEEKVQPEAFSPAYVAPTTGPAVRSSIEDNPDIPYITPPVEQLSKRDQQAYLSKV